LIIFAVLIAAGKENIQNGKVLEDIISRHIEAHGGYENLGMAGALEYHGKFTGFSVINDFYLLKTRDGEFYMDYSLGKYRLLEGSDGITFWTIDPWQDFDFPRRINKAERHVIMQKSEMITPFYRWKERGFSVELLDNEIMDDIEMYVLSLTRPGMTPEKWYLNAETYLAYKNPNKMGRFCHANRCGNFL
jgi:hypothetical protein